MQNGVVQSVASAPSSPKTVYITTTDGNTNDSSVYFNNDVLAQNASQNWKAAKKVGLPSNRLYSTIAIDPKNPKIAYLGVQGFGTGHVFRTDSNGAAWHDVTPFLVMDNQRVQIDTPVNCILIDPLFPSNLYVATDVGVFVSTDSGVSWQPHGTSLPRTAILELKMSADRKVVAATHGRGAWQIDPLSH
jgi:ligand-binding sensor domain-containing protein